MAYVFAAAKRDGFGWSIHRPHTIIGYALGNAMNMGVTLALELDVDAAGRLVWDKRRAVSRQRHSAGASIDRRRSDLGRSRTQVQSRGEEHRSAGLRLAHRRRPWAPDRGRYRHEQESKAWLPRLS